MGGALASQRLKLRTTRGWTALAGFDARGSITMFVIDRKLEKAAALPLADLVLIEHGIGQRGVGADGAAAERA